jgi:hypothetical protein
MPLKVLSSGYTLPITTGKARAKLRRPPKSGKVKMTHFIELFGFFDW